MDSRDVEILFQYLEKLVRGVNKIGEELEMANSYETTVVDASTPLHREDIRFEGKVRGGV